MAVKQTDWVIPDFCQAVINKRVHPPDGRVEHLITAPMETSRTFKKPSHGLTLCVLDGKKYPWEIPHGNTGVCIHTDLYLEILPRQIQQCVCLCPQGLRQIQKAGHTQPALHGVQCVKISVPALGLHRNILVSPIDSGCHGKLPDWLCQFPRFRLQSGM